MFQAIPVREENIFAFKATGKLTDKDYQQFLPELTSLINQYGPISLLIELDDFHGWDAEAAWDDFKFGEQHEDDFVRIALVGQKHWQKWMSIIGNAFTKTKVRFFNRDDLQEAWDWLREDDQTDNHSKQIVENDIEVLKPYAHIVVAIDFSSHSNHVLDRALELAQRYNACLSLIHTIEHFTHTHSEYDLVMTAYDDTEMDQALYEYSVSHLDKIAKSLNHPCLQHEVLWGNPKSTILSYATAQNADLIVAGSHGHHGLARLLGSTTTGIIHSAKCDVMVVRLSDV